MKKSNEKTKPRQRSFHFDLGLFLLVTGSIANMPMWIGAFMATEENGPISIWIKTVMLPVFGVISALAMGLTVSVGLIYVIARLNTMKPTIEHKVRGKDEYKSTPNIRYYVAWGSLVVLIVVSPALLGVQAYVMLAGAESLYNILGDPWAGVWSVGRILAADLALGAVAMVYGVHLPASATSTAGATGASQSSNSPATATQSGKSASRTPKKSGNSAADTRPCDVKGCGIPYKWPNGKGAHFRQYHPDLIVRKSIPVAAVAQSSKPQDVQA